MHQKIPLEEVMPLLNFPVYGLPEEMFGLCYTDYRHVPEYPIRIDYQGERYAPFLHEKVRGPTLSVHSWQSRSQLGIRSAQLHVVRWEDAGIPEQDCRDVFVVDSCLIIDGAPFTGTITYRPAPLYHSLFIPICIQWYNAQGINSAHWLT